MRKLVIGALVGVFLVPSSEVIESQGLAATSANVRRLAKDLTGVSAEDAVSAAKALGDVKGSAAGAALIRCLELGAPPAVLVAVIEALGKHRDRRSFTILKHYASYRGVPVRVAALAALSELSVKGVDAILIDALGDSSAKVRGLAAEKLAERNARQAEGVLFALVKRHDALAAGPLGQLASATTATELADLVGEVPDALIASAFGKMLLRADFGPDPLRVQVVKALGRLRGVEATAALVEYVASVPEHEVRRSKAIAEQLIADRG